MSALVFDTDEETWVTGELVCVDSSTSKAVKYDENNPLPVVGTCFKPAEGTMGNGRMWFAINGIPYYNNAEVIYNEDLTTDGTENVNFTPWNPFDAGKVLCINIGMSSVIKTQVGIPERWILLSVGIERDWYIVS